MHPMKKEDIETLGEACSWWPFQSSVIIKLFSWTRSRRATLHRIIHCYLVDMCYFTNLLETRFVLNIYNTLGSHVDMACCVCSLYILEWKQSKVVTWVIQKIHEVRYCAWFLPLRFKYQHTCTPALFAYVCLHCTPAYFTLPLSNFSNLNTELAPANTSPLSTSYCSALHISTWYVIECTYRTLSFSQHNCYR